MTGPLLRGFVPHFISLRRQPDPEKLLGLVKKIESIHRERFGITTCDDDEIAALVLRPKGQTPEEQAALRVVRMCIAVRYDFGQRGLDALKPPCPALDKLQHALNEADADKVLGTMSRPGLRRGGAVTAEDKKAAAREQLARDVVAANKLLKGNPKLSITEIASRIVRGQRSADWLRRKLVNRNGKIVGRHG